MLARGGRRLADAGKALTGRGRRGTVLVLDLTRPLAEERGDRLGRLLTRGRPSLSTVVETLAHAGADDRVAGLLCRVGAGSWGLADAQEVRAAILGFRATGAFAVAHAETFGEFAPGNVGYYLASACDEVHLQPSGGVGLTGLAAEVRFVRGTLDRLGIVPQLDHRHEYKNAKNVLTETGFTPAHREATERLVDSLAGQLVADVAQARGLDEERVRELIDAAPLSATDALAGGLVDRLAYRDETVAALKARARGPRSGEEAALEDLRLYARKAGRRRQLRARLRRDMAKVALVHARGAVVQGESRFHPLTRQSLGADTVTRALRQAADDEQVAAILLRVDSPGGSYVASDAIWREVVRCRGSGTPVVVSMGNVAASGGYFVAMPADRILAHPGTITGSIGVLAGKAVTAELQEKLGLATDAAHVGEHALIASPSSSFTESEWQRLQAWLDEVYDDFTAKAADGRGLPVQRVREHARGRVWTGADAAQRGLVDALGGYGEALRAVREFAGLDPDADVRLENFPRPAPLPDRLRGRHGRDEFAGRTGLTGASDLESLAGRLLLGLDGVLSLPADVPLRWR